MIYSLAIIASLLLGTQAALAAPAAGKAGTYTNPLRQNGPDPFIVYDQPSSKYWFVSTSNTDLRVTSSSTLGGLATASQKVVYSSSETQNDGNTWAPELHKIGNTWYLYFSLHYNPFVLTGGSTPAGPYSNPVQLSNDWGIDGTVLSLNGASYFAWSCLRPLTGFAKPQQSICISKLLTPTKIDSANIGVISQPDQPWEQIGTADVPAVNEGPNPLYWAGETYFCGTASYSLGLLHYIGGDPVNPASWHKKKDRPVFSSNNGEYGTGHNGNFLSPDGTQVWNVFHAVTNPQGSCGTDRATFALQLNTTNFNPAVGPIWGPIPPLNTVLPGPSNK